MKAHLERTRTPGNTGNPLLPGRGVCDPHVRIFGSRAYMYATHDASPDNDHFVMKDWWIWSSPDLVHWTHECTLRPEMTYLNAGFSSCWATDAAERNGRYYWYFSEANKRTGVVVGDTPVGPWRDPIRKPLIGDNVIPVGAYDPGIFVDDDGTPYIVVGVWEFYIARLNEDMISLGGPPRRLDIRHPEGPYGKGRTDDKPFLHKCNGIYYLSWGCFYAVSDRLEGPYDCRGSIIVEKNVSPSLRYHHKPITYDRHGSFFKWRGQWYFICNDMSRSQNVFFRDTCISMVHYRSNGDIEPVHIDPRGVIPL